MAEGAYDQNETRDGIADDLWLIQIPQGDPGSSRGEPPFDAHLHEFPRPDLPIRYDRHSIWCMTKSHPACDNDKSSA
jgi:hypothetical protein